MMVFGSHISTTSESNISIIQGESHVYKGKVKRATLETIARNTPRDHRTARQRTYCFAGVLTHQLVLHIIWSKYYDGVAKVSLFLS